MGGSIYQLGRLIRFRGPIYLGGVARPEYFDGKTTVTSGFTSGNTKMPYKREKGTTYKEDQKRSFDFNTQIFSAGAEVPIARSGKLVMGFYAGKGGYKKEDKETKDDYLPSYLSSRILTI